MVQSFFFMLSFSFQVTVNLFSNLPNTDVWYVSISVNDKKNIKSD